MPQAGQEAPARREFPLGLRIECGAPRGVVLVALQWPGPAVVVGVAPSPLFLVVVIAPHGEREASAGELRRARPAQVEPVIEAVEVDDTARSKRAGAAKREKLLDLTAPSVGG